MDGPTSTTSRCMAVSDASPEELPGGRRVRRKLTALLCVGLLSASLAACGDDDGEEGEGSDGERTSEELTPITVGILPIAALAPMYHGIDQGYFADEGLDVTTEIGQGGAALTPSVVSGEHQFAFGNYISLMLARENDVPIQVVSNVANGSDNPDRGTDGLLVAPDSGIDSIDDLADKTFAVAGLSGIEEVAIRAMLDEHDVDASGITFTEVPFPDMNAAVDAGRVDVAAQVEPFVTLGQADGLVRLADPIYEAVPSMPLGIVFASEDWLEDNPETANAFYRALQRSLEASADEETMRQVIAENTETPPGVVEQMALDNWQAEVDRDALATVGELAARYGVLAEEPDLDELIWTPG
jgi:NitT/TauT family transport system substrate-binding protein